MLSAPASVAIITVSRSRKCQQRIGRCHCYGRKPDLVIVNFVDRSNEADARVIEQETLKLEAWADDLKLGLEQRIKEFDREIKNVRRRATISPEKQLFTIEWGLA